MLIQIPTLILAGWFVGRNLKSNMMQDWNEGGLPGLFISLVFILFWMIPRWLDASLNETLWEILKFTTIPLLIGIPLGMSWFRMSGFARAVVWTNGISMLVVVGWLYVSSPIRVCNNYLVNQQEEFGYAAMILALVIAFFWVVFLFFGSWKQPIITTGDDLH
ncbi:hypothetical protein [Ghiorsea bivora]|uniref:hypothetical protein n=1 Tax=Ghiorsea bivora TaxID=1485545 RepID=UPI00069133AD|nr:hypothetical protein [Ghiorsea bivora]